MRKETDDKKGGDMDTIFESERGNNVMGRLIQPENHPGAHITYSWPGQGVTWSDKGLIYGG